MLGAMSHHPQAFFYQNSPFSSYQYGCYNADVSQPVFSRMQSGGATQHSAASASSSTPVARPHATLSDIDSTQMTDDRENTVHQRSPWGFAYQVARPQHAPASCFSEVEQQPCHQQQQQNQQTMIEEVDEDEDIMMDDQSVGKVSTATQHETAAQQQQQQIRSGSDSRALVPLNTPQFRPRCASIEDLIQYAASRGYNIDASQFLPKPGSGFISLDSLQQYCSKVFPLPDIDNIEQFRRHPTHVYEGGVIIEELDEDDVDQDDDTVAPAQPQFVEPEDYDTQQMHDDNEISNSTVNPRYSAPYGNTEAQRRPRIRSQKRRHEAAFEPVSSFVTSNSPQASAASAFSTPNTSGIRSGVPVDEEEIAAAVREQLSLGQPPAKRARIVQ